MIDLEDFKAAACCFAAMASNDLSAHSTRAWVELLEGLGVDPAAPGALAGAMEGTSPAMAFLNGLTLGIIAGRADAARLAAD